MVSQLVQTVLLLCSSFYFIEIFLLLFLNLIVHVTGYMLNNIKMYSNYGTLLLLDICFYECTLTYQNPLYFHFNNLLQILFI